MNSNIEKSKSMVKCNNENKGIRITYANRCKKEQPYPLNFIYSMFYYNVGEYDEKLDIIDNISDIYQFDLRLYTSEFIHTTIVNAIREACGGDDLSRNYRIVKDIFIYGDSQKHEAEKYGITQCRIKQILNEAWMHTIRILRDKYNESIKSEELSVSSLGISYLAYNCLRRAKLNNLSDLIAYINKNGLMSLMKIRGLGKKSIDDIQIKLKEKGYDC